MEHGDNILMRKVSVSYDLQPQCALLRVVSSTSLTIYTTVNTSTAYPMLL